MAVWRMYLEQGGIDAYTGMPLDLESMDLEHVVGYNNTDKNDPPSNDEFRNREHERNQVLCSSRANQQKSDQSMSNFNTNNVESLKDMSKQDFENREGAYKTVNEGTTVTQQTALRLQGDIRYKLKGSNETTTDANDPNIDKNEKGLPKVADATLGPNVTPEVLQKEYDARDGTLPMDEMEWANNQGWIEALEFVLDIDKDIREQKAREERVNSILLTDKERNYIIGKTTNTKKIE